MNLTGINDRRGEVKFARKVEPIEPLNRSAGGYGNKAERRSPALQFSREMLRFKARVICGLETRN